MKVTGCDRFISVMLMTLAVFAFINGAILSALLMLAFPFFMIITFFVDRMEAKSLARPEPLVIGRTQRDWYDTIKDIGPEITEELMIGPLDGLERDQESAWNPETLMGKELWKHLRKEWYPELFCKYCNNEGCKETCGKAATAKAEEEWRFLVGAPKKKAIDKPKTDIYVDGFSIFVETAYYRKLKQVEDDYAKLQQEWLRLEKKRFRY
jgi:hypothetical protein